jgi:hypothetical protein
MALAGFNASEVWQVESFMPSRFVMSGLVDVLFVDGRTQVRRSLHVHSIKKTSCCFCTVQQPFCCLACVLVVGAGLAVLGVCLLLGGFCFGGGWKWLLLWEVSVLAATGDAYYQEVSGENRC